MKILHKCLGVYIHQVVLDANVDDSEFASEQVFTGKVVLNVDMIASV